MSLWLVRHAEAEWPAALALGQSDPGLSNRGWEQSETLALRFAAERLDCVITSDLRRAVQTAERIAGPHGLRVETWPELREVDFGAWERRQLSDLWVEDPTAAKHWEADPTHFPAGFGETFPALEARVKVARARLLQIAPAPVLVVAHGGSLRLLLALLLRVAPRLAWVEDWPLGGVREIAWAATLEASAGRG
ncbi:MAG: histidine phosphatase family protein [Candidatus Dormibacteria bacterium]